MVVYQKPVLLQFVSSCVSICTQGVADIILNKQLYLHIIHVSCIILVTIASCVINISGNLLL